VALRRGMRWTAFIVGFGLAVLQIGTALPAVTEHSGWTHGGGFAAAKSRSSRCWNPKEPETGFAKLINQARNNGERSKLRLDPELSKAARVHTQEMVKRSLLHHTTSPTLSKRVTRWRLLGENVGVGNTVDSLHQAFMGSPAHRANVMHSEFRYVGVGVATVGGRMWVTVIFENQVDPGTILNMPSCKRAEVVLESRTGSQVKSRAEDPVKPLVRVLRQFGSIRWIGPAPTPSSS